MSDPVANVEIEDVLTSIRRLVSEGGRQAAPAKEPRNVVPDVAAPSVDVQEEPDSEPEALDRLVLTPALRISEIEEIEEVEEKVPEPEVPELLLNPVVVPEQDDDAQGHADGEPLEAESQDEVAQDVAETAFDPDEGIALSEAQAMDSRIVRWETLNSEEQSELIEPDSPGDSDYAGTEVRGLSWIEPVMDEVPEAAEPEDKLEEEASELEGATALSDDDGGIEMPVFLRPEPAEIQTEIEEPEAESVGEIDEDSVAPDSSSEPEEMSDLEALEAVAQSIDAETTAYVEASVEEAIAPELEAFDQDDTVMLDEAMLRELVSDIVRQELQGALGERITRNVRKLVRREIHRALAAHDME